jgi:hypothetical protein
MRAPRPCRHHRCRPCPRADCGHYVLFSGRPATSLPHRLPLLVEVTQIRLWVITRCEDDGRVVIAAVTGRASALAESPGSYNASFLQTFGDVVCDTSDESGRCFLVKRRRQSPRKIVFAMTSSSQKLPAARIVLVPHVDKDLAGRARQLTDAQITYWRYIGGWLVKMVDQCALAMNRSFDETLTPEGVVVIEIFFFQNLRIADIGIFRGIRIDGLQPVIGEDICNQIFQAWLRPVDSYWS